MESLTYAGLGSRETPKDILEVMEKLAARLASAGWVLRTGGAPGADKAFLEGASLDDEHLRLIELYLPWDGFEGYRYNDLFHEVYVKPEPSPEAFDVGKQYHPAWFKLSQGARRLMARNSHQVLGPDLASPVDAVICWTEGAKLKGGTAQALRIAADRGIPVYNLGDNLTFRLLSDIL